MYSYKFRVSYDEIEDFVRDIVILSSDNFESFHNILYSSIGLQGNELASFFICDTKWNKKKEITLIDMDDEENVEEIIDYDDDDAFTTKSNLPKFIMKDAILKDYIDNPRQYIIYEYDFLNPKVFFVELITTLKVDTTDGYPKCTFKEKELPKETPHFHSHKNDPTSEDEYIPSLSNDDIDDSDLDDNYEDDDIIDFDIIDENQLY